jgi:hypothetical protein
MVTIGAPCPVCGAEAEWTGTRQPTAGDSTSYVVACPRCEPVAEPVVAAPVNPAHTDAIRSLNASFARETAFLAGLRARYGITREAS